MALDGWVGVSGRLIAACMQTDVTFHIDGRVTGYRKRKGRTIDGVRRRGRVLPVDVVVEAYTRRIPPYGNRQVFGRYLGLEGNFLLPHVVLWDADREVLLVDLGSLIPERVPEEYPPQWASLIHCIAFGNQDTAAERIEGLLDSQCSGWRGAIAVDYTLEELKLPSSKHGTLDDQIYHANVENAFAIGQKAGQP